MDKYISKSALVAHLATLLDKKKYSDEYEVAFRDGNNSAIYAISHLLNTLDVKEVDLEREINDYFITVDLCKGEEITENTFSRIAKHFFELGLKAQKGK